MTSLQGKIALITGAGRGIGKAISLSLTKSGCRVVLASRTRSELEEVQKEIKARGGEDAMVVPADLTRDEDIHGLIEKTHKERGTVDILINNAGWGKRSPVVKANVEDWDRTFDLNLRAPMILAKLVLPDMIAK